MYILNLPEFANWIKIAELAHRRGRRRKIPFFDGRDFFHDADAQFSDIFGRRQKRNFFAAFQIIIAQGADFLSQELFQK